MTMWSATHIKVTIQSARGLLCKGKNNTNNCYVTIAMGKEKYQTSVKEKAESNVQWNEECELKIPDQGNRAELVLTCLHRNNLGIDEFLGQVTLPLNEMDPYDRPRPKWFKLESKPGKEKKNKERGELMAMISFTVKSGSLTDLSKKEKHKSSIGQLASSVGGSLLSIGQIEKRKGIKKIAKKFGSKLHLPTGSKKKNKDGDEDGMSYTGSFASIGTPNRVRVIDSEDEDEFQFDKLSQKSSVSSLNLRDGGGLQTPASNYANKNSSPLMGSTGKGKDHHLRYDGSDNLSVDPELEEIENEFSIRARTLPPPSKPPRTPQMDISVNGGGGAGDIRINGKHNNSELDEWESKLYGRSADSGNSDSLKRRSWEPVAVPLSSSNNVAEESVVVASNNESMSKSFLPPLREAHTPETLSDSSSSSSDEEEEEPPKLSEKPKAPKVPKQSPEKLEEEVKPKKPTDLKFVTATNESTKSDVVLRKDSLLSPEEEKNEFAKFNASFAKFEQRHSAKVFDIEEETNNFLANETMSSAKSRASPPQPKPRPRSSASLEKEKEQLRVKEEEEAAKEKLRLQRAAEDAKLEAELKANEKRLREEEQALQKELEEREEEKRREAKRREEDLRILNFSKRLVTPEETKENPFVESPKPKEQTKEEPKKKEKVEIKERPTFNNNSTNNYNNRGERGEKKQSVSTASTPSPKTNERIIIGHEKSSTQAERRAEISAALAKKYEGKSREELMLIANGMENEALLQRQRVKELEDYLDNLLLRVMETQPKLLQNPYSRTTSAKSFKNYINMNDFL
ncbi:rab11 family-interacting protein 1 [Musca vetustissima]|uniref:rab11 family-interacting protein 1 n=1 Tax=Musca vetustissima TaxID=27455 RepID=UPI002AB61F5E|nr:rab11 family-interacting protein 1 [Musca vetustissima]